MKNLQKLKSWYEVSADNIKHMTQTVNYATENRYDDIPLSKTVATVTSLFLF